MNGARVVRTSGCIDCGFCETRVRCDVGEHRCHGCGNCVKGCPAGARRLVRVAAPATQVQLKVDGVDLRAPEGIALKTLLASLGKDVCAGSGCGSGGCWSCALLVDGLQRPACAVAVTEGMEVATTGEEFEKAEARRVVSFYPQHFHASMSVFTHGCNFSCGFCHNWDLTFSSVDRALTAAEAATLTKRLTSSSGNRRTGISGGEPTLNRKWLVEYVGRVSLGSPGVAIQVDTNGSLLTPDYIDELYQAGMTDLSVDLKGLHLETFLKISGESDRDAASLHLSNAWKAVEYAAQSYPGRLCVMAAIPYHPSFIGAEEVRVMGEKLAEIRKEIDVNLMIYQPAFRMRGADPAAEEDIDRAFTALEETGVTAWCQEGDDIPAALDPDDGFGDSVEEW